ncbi:hypothetical protein P9302_20815 [Brevibacillus agri]|uniref:hypothetical protein n=1 Tax=Brevibacillus agri TaxID=51101 RepID=UPI0024BF166A|nr:hypothetical protein [Brevibacillus agri]MED4571879.1 hypothetical protein [Brevibacillus agri]WHX29484.1 hypothetical protein QNK09_20695 [Brevibacillus agri]
MLGLAWLGWVGLVGLVGLLAWLAVLALLVLLTCLPGLLCLLCLSCLLACLAYLLARLALLALLVLLTCLPGLLCLLALLACPTAAFFWLIDDNDYHIQLQNYTIPVCLIFPHIRAVFLPYARARSLIVIFLHFLNESVSLSVSQWSKKRRFGQKRGKKRRYLEISGTKHPKI